VVANFIKLTDLIGLDELQKIQDSFALATGVAACIHEVDGTPITKPSNWCELCANYHRKSEIGYKRCLKSDANLGARAGQLRQPVVDYCTSGHLVEAAVPIIVDGRHIGTATCGQVLYQPPKLAEYREIAKEIGVNEAGYLKAVKKVTIMPQERFQGVVSHLYQVANALSILGQRGLKEERLKKDLACAREDTERMARDMTEVKQKEKAAEELKLLLDYATASLPDMLFTFDKNGVVSYVNPAFEKATGFAKADMVGMRVEKFPALPAELRPMIAQRVRRRLVTGEAVSNVELELITKEGNIIPVSYSASGIRDAQGNVIGEVVTVRDMTETKKAEAELKNIPSRVSRGDLTGRIEAAGLSGNLKVMAEDTNEIIDKIRVMTREVEEEKGRV